MALTPTEEAQTRALLAQQSQILSLASEEPAILSSLGATDVNLSQLPAASSVSDADLLLIRQGSTDKSVAGSIVKSYATTTVNDASETVKGIVELATTVETQSGTDTVRAVHPAGLASLTSTETRAGLIELATTVETQSGTDTVRAVTPYGLRSGLNASGSAPIYACRAWVNFNGTETVAIRASGNVSSITDNGVGDYTVNFTTAMPDTNYAVSLSGNRASRSIGLICGIRAAPTTSAVSLSFFEYSSDAADSIDTTLSIFR